MQGRGCAFVAGRESLWVVRKSGSAGQLLSCRGIPFPVGVVSLFCVSTVAVSLVAILCEGCCFFGTSAHAAGRESFLGPDLVGRALWAPTILAPCGSCGLSAGVGRPEVC